MDVYFLLISIACFHPFLVMFVIAHWFARPFSGWCSSIWVSMIYFAFLFPPVGFNTSVAWIGKTIIWSYFIDYFRGSWINPINSIHRLCERILWSILGQEKRRALCLFRVVISRFQHHFHNSVHWHLVIWDWVLSNGPIFSEPARNLFWV